MGQRRGYAEFSNRIEMAVESNQLNKSLQKLIEICASNQDGASIAYNELRNSLVRFFQIKGDFDPDEAADLTLDRAALKIPQDTSIENLTGYCFGVARFIFLERVRHAKKLNAAADEFYRMKNSSGIVRETDDEFFAFRECFEKLTSAEKLFLRDYFADLPFSELDKRRRQTCLESGITLNNLRLKVFRLRRRLEDCVKNELR